MISTDKKFIFVAVMKTGTMSMTKTLEKHSIDKDGYHYTAKELKEGKLLSDMSMRFGSNNKHMHLYKKFWNEYYSFGFVRNPWDHFVSLYKWCKKNNNPKTLNGFEYFLLNQYENEFDCLLDWNFTNQTDRLYDHEKQLVNFVGRFESIEEDFSTICKKIGVEDRLLFINKSKDCLNYKSFYKSSLQIEMIKDLYHRDIHRCGYEFE